MYVVFKQRKLIGKFTSFDFCRVNKIQSEVGTQILQDFEEALSVRGAKVSSVTVITQ
jgi:hypothetical protein